MTRWGRRSAGSPMTSTSSTRRGTRSRIRSTSADRRGASPAISAPYASSAAAAASAPGTSSKPGTRRFSRSSSGSGDRHRVFLRTTSTPTPGGPPHLCATGRQQRPATGDRHPAGGLRGVHEQRHPCRAARLGDLRHRLERADLVVGRLQAGQRRVGPQRRGELLRVDAARTADAHRGDPAAVALVPARPRAARWSARPRSPPGAGPYGAARAGRRARRGGPPGCLRR